MTVLDSVRVHARSQPNALACADLTSGDRYSYDALNAAVDSCAAWLCGRLQPGARFAWLGRNSTTLLIAQLACERAGLIFVPLNWRLAPAEIAALVQDAQPGFLVADADFASVAATVNAPWAERCAFDGGLIQGARPPDQLASGLDAPATLLYTSGTSGRPKGVIVSRRGGFHGALNFAVANHVTATSVFLCDMPMFHVAGLYAAARTPLLMGGSTLISAGFEAATTLSRLYDASLSITHYFCVTQMAQMLRQHPTFDPAPLRRLTAFCTGGAPNPPASVRRWIEDGVPMVDGYGMSETGSSIGMPLGDLDRIAAKAGACGLPYLSLQARLVDDRGQDVTDGEPGELWMRGPNVTQGYWNRPEETERAFQDGWFRSGDIMRRDADGFFWPVDRCKDMFVSGGENVYPAEIEAAIAELADVSEVAVIGVADARWGEVGRAFVVPRPGAALSADDVAAHCRTRLAGYKNPKSIVLAEALPRTASGKVQKHILRSQHT
jgi:fatty-acyl-CoA synthase